MTSSVCAIPGCGRQTAEASGTGRAPNHCRYHVQRKSRHGSHWHPTYRAVDLKPYVSAAKSWLADNSIRPSVVAALTDLEYTLAFAGRVDPAMNLRGQPAIYRARVAFGRLREAGVTSHRLASIYLGVAALIEDDSGSHRVREFQIVQAAKAVHRLASGTHRKWSMWNPSGPDVAFEVNAYPRSAGLVLRRIGEALAQACDPLLQEAIQKIILIKTEAAGPHPSHIPEWRPL